MKEVTHQVSLFFTGCISNHDSDPVSRQLTGECGELLLVVVEMVDHIHHARSKTSSRNYATAMTRSRQSHKPSFAILPITVLKGECVHL